MLNLQLPNQHHVYHKLEKVVDSCVILPQMIVAVKVLDQYRKLYQVPIDNRDLDRLYERLTNKINQTN